MAESNVLLLDKRMQNLIKDYVPCEDITQSLVNFFTIFSDSTRIKMLSALSITEMCVTDISVTLNLNQTTVSHQLRLLKNLGAVTSRRNGKIIFYSLKNDLLSDVLIKGIEFLSC